MMVLTCFGQSRFRASRDWSKWDGQPWSETCTCIGGPYEGGRFMPAGSSKKRERQYEHIKDSYQERGVSKDEAEERAARTVNKERREAGETKNQKTS
jgi:hypothetical protein